MPSFHGYEQDEFSFEFTFNWLAKGCTVRGLNPGEGRELSPPVKTVPGAHPVYFKMGAEYLLRRQMCRGVTLTNHPNLDPRLKKE